jgi:hypothetical protein
MSHELHEQLKGLQSIGEVNAEEDAVLQYFSRQMQRRKYNKIESI